MTTSTLIHHDVAGMLEHVIHRPGRSVDARIEEAWRLLCKYRAELVAERLFASGERTVRAGPFRGMVLLSEVAEGCTIPKLLGIYEEELHDRIAALPGRGHELILNVGCAEGYYAVGLARLAASATVHAFDVDPRARELCSELARVNGVESRVTVGGALEPEDVARYEGRRVFVLCDIEGAERELLDPARAPALAGMDLLVEVHDAFEPGCTEALVERFEGTHCIEPIRFSARRDAAFPELEGLDEMDRLLACWEGRVAGNGWLGLDRRSPST